MEDENKNGFRNVITGNKVVTVVSIIGFCIGGFLFGWNLYFRRVPQMIIFLLITLICAGFFVNNVKSKK
ncbi:MAG: hypothetical protein J6Y69_01430 [Treponema sp.]|nr:hypothetical protein [Treponema sp.]